MAAESGPPPPPPTPEPAPRADAAQPHAGERCGPVAIARYEKPDGRALILFTSDAPQRT